jgi:hypothetical protein
MKVSSVVKLFLSCTMLGAANTAVAQDNSFGSNDLYYNRQVNDGVFASASYDSQYYSFLDFYENLAPYGQWIHDSRLGYVWCPDVEGDFRPYYTNGQWILTGHGNTWVSNYNWGWACFHYGRWTFNNYYGWLWVPGQNWGPAWVSWRANATSYGWAPLSPEYEFSASEFKKYDCPKDWWIFIPKTFVYSKDHYRYYTGAMGSSTILRTSEYTDNTYTRDGITFVSGPTEAQVKEAHDNKAPTVYKVYNAGTPRVDRIFRETVKMFRPSVINGANMEGEQYTPNSYIKAPYAIGQAEAVNLMGADKKQLAFRRELPELLKKNAATVKPVRQVKTDNVVTKEAQRADKAEYRTDVKSINPKVKGSLSAPKPSTAVVPPQGSQQPEPVPKPKGNQLPPLPPATQHGDPIPTPTVVPGAPQPAPVQHPEPVNPGGR